MEYEGRDIISTDFYFQMTVRFHKSQTDLQPEKNNIIKRILATTSYFLLEPSHFMIGYRFPLLNDGAVLPL